jgi:hypothetical protein
MKAIGRRKKMKRNVALFARSRVACAVRAITLRPLSRSAPRIARIAFRAVASRLKRWQRTRHLARQRNINGGIIARRVKPTARVARRGEKHHGSGAKAAGIGRRNDGENKKKKKKKNGASARRGGSGVNKQQRGNGGRRRNEAAASGGENVKSA